MNTFQPKEITSEVAEETLNQALIGAGLDGFYFNTSFSLRFFGESRAPLGNTPIPRSIRLTILADWSIRFLHNERDSASWTDTEESKLAASLVKLRWSEHSIVSGLKVNSAGLELYFDDFASLSISAASEDDYSYLFEDADEPPETGKWFITLENGRYYCPA